MPLDEEPMDLNPEHLRLEVARKLYRKALSVYESLLLSQDPKIRKDVARDILEIAGAKAPKGQAPSGNVNIALFPPEYIAKVSSGLAKFQRAEIIDIEGYEKNAQVVPQPPLRCGDECEPDHSGDSN